MKLTQPQNTLSEHTQWDRNAYTRQYIRDRTEGLRNAIFNYLGNTCSKCRFSDTRALEIHHVHGKGNEHRRLFITNLNYLKDVLKQVREGSKDYRVLCANCHRIELLDGNNVPAQTFFAENPPMISGMFMEGNQKTFIGKVQVGRRVQIPEPYVIVLGLKEGDIVEVSIKKIEPSKATSPMTPKPEEAQVKPPEPNG